MPELESSQSDTLEIEHKFLYNFDIVKKLDELGATFLNETTNESDLVILDEYFDNLSSYFLILNDCWLRKRTKNNENKWQLKYPSKRIVNQDENFDNYVEIEKQDEIQKFLIDLFKNYFPSVETTTRTTTHNFDSLVFDSFKLEPFCLINSKRKSFLLDNVGIDLDETDFGFNCGELEVMLSKNANAEQIQDSVRSIHQAASKLGKNSRKKKTKIYVKLQSCFFEGIEKLKFTPGKVPVYLFKFQPHIYKLLCEHHIVKDCSDLLNVLLKNINQN
jgi:hypothetical protein